MYCPQCGSEVKEGAQFCGNCGKKFDNSIPPIEAVVGNYAAFGKGLKTVSIAYSIGIVMLIYSLVIDLLGTVITVYLNSNDLMDDYTIRSVVIIAILYIIGMIASIIIDTIETAGYITAAKDNPVLYASATVSFVLIIRGIVNTVKNIAGETGDSNIFLNIVFLILFFAGIAITIYSINKSAVASGNSAVSTYCKNSINRFLIPCILLVVFKVFGSSLFNAIDVDLSDWNLSVVLDIIIGVIDTILCIVIYALYIQVLDRGRTLSK